MKCEFKHNWKCFEKMMNRVMFCSCVNKRLVVFKQNISLWIKNTSFEKFKHYSTATLMLVTSGCWWFYVSDNFSVLVPDAYAKSKGCWQRWTKPSPTSQSCRQQISSRTSIWPYSTATVMLMTDVGEGLLYIWVTTLRITDSYTKISPINLFCHQYIYNVTINVQSSCPLYLVGYTGH